MKVRDVMTPRVISIETDAPIMRAVRLMLQNRISGLPVVGSKGELVGMVTEGDFLRRGELGNWCSASYSFRLVLLSSPRRRKSPSVTIPTSSPLEPTTGRPLIRFCSIRRTARMIGASVSIDMTRGVITSVLSWPLSSRLAVGDRNRLQAFSRVSAERLRNTIRRDEES